MSSTIADSAVYVPNIDPALSVCDDSFDCSSANGFDDVAAARLLVPGSCVASYAVIIREFLVESRIRISEFNDTH